MKFKPLLVEIFCEELPPMQVWALARDFPDLLLTALRDAGFANDKTARAHRENGEAILLATPRRFAALLDGVLTDSPESEMIRRGPAVSACYLDDSPTKPLIGFMHSVGATCEKQLIRVHEKNREHVAFRQTLPGVALAEVLANIIERTLLSISAPRLMRWGNNDFKFIRPVRGLLMLHGDTPILVGKLFGVAPAKDTVGHLTLANKRLTIPTATAYEETLEQGAVVVDIQKRKQAIAARLTNQPETALTDEVAAMCEQPAVYTGAFDEAFLQLPSFCTEECLSKHQRAFPIYRDEKLTAQYLFVADNRPPDAASMISGFNTVVQARLQDVKFYIDEDKKLSIEDALTKLNNITYHHQLGSQRQRTERLQIIAGDIATRLALSAADKAQLQKAAMLCKCDLPTLLIGEYPHLAGMMAAIYFCEDDTRDLVRCHNARDWQQQIATLPNKTPALKTQVLRTQALALLLANQLEKLVGMFGVGEKPSGSKDPHGLRAAAIITAGVLCETKRLLPLDDLLTATAGAFEKLPAFDKNTLWDFISERIRYDLQASGQNASVLNAVLATRQKYIADIEEKSSALSAFMQMPEADNLIEANKRSSNILRRSAANDSIAPPTETLLTEDAERILYAQLSDCEKQNIEAMRDNNYTAVLSNTAKLQPAVSAFFEQVLVNTEDAATRDNRFALLANLRQQLNLVGDLSLLSR